jgi:2-phospho-L-lactate guanylyltransferase
MTASVRVIVPMKPLDAGKRRLGNSSRPALILMMLDRVVRTVTDAIGREMCWVIGGDELARKVTCDAGGRWMEDRGSDLNTTVYAGMERAFEEGARAAIFIPADVPMITAQDVLTIIDVSEGLARPVGVEARADGGTNALLLPAGANIQLAFGHQSYRLHRANAERAGLPLVSAPAPGLAFDLDSLDDLRYAAATVPGFDEQLERWDAWVASQSARPQLATDRS